MLQMSGTAYPKFFYISGSFADTIMSNCHPSQKPLYENECQDVTDKRKGQIV